MSRITVFTIIWCVVTIALYSFFLFNSTISSVPVLCWIASAFLAILATLLLNLAMTAEIPAKTMLVARNYEIVRIFHEKTKLWEWNKILRGSNLVSFERRHFDFTMETTILSGSGVHELLYNVKIEIPGTPREIAKLFVVFKNDEGFEEDVRSQLYEFNESHKKDLSKFYNPLDKNQQEEFSKLVTEFLVKNFASIERYPNVVIVPIEASFSL